MLTSNQGFERWGEILHDEVLAAALLDRLLHRCHIGKMPVSEVTSADILEVLSSMWHVRAPTAWRVRKRVCAIVECAVAMELRADNPCDRTGRVLGPQSDVVQYMWALPHREVATAIDTVRAADAPLVPKLALELLVLTAASWGEVWGAVWAEI